MGLGGDFLVFLKVVKRALPAGEPAPHVFGGFIQTCIVMLTPKVAGALSLFAHARVGSTFAILVRIA